MIHVRIMRRYSTDEVAEMLDIQRPNLQRLIRQKRIPFPPLEQVGRLKIRLWTKADVEKARKVLNKKYQKQSGASTKRG
jgi:excisionase family DNA binding protein